MEPYYTASWLLTTAQVLFAVSSLAMILFVLLPVNTEESEESIGEPDPNLYTSLGVNIILQLSEQRILQKIFKKKIDPKKAIGVLIVVCFIATCYQLSQEANSFDLYPWTSLTPYIAPFIVSCYPPHDANNLTAALFRRSAIFLSCTSLSLLYLPIKYTLGGKDYLHFLATFLITIPNMITYLYVWGSSYGRTGIARPWAAQLSEEILSAHSPNLPNDPSISPTPLQETAILNRLMNTLRTLDTIPSIAISTQIQDLQTAAETHPDDQIKEALTQEVNKVVNHVEQLIGSDRLNAIVTRAQNQNTIEDIAVHCHRVITSQADQTTLIRDGLTNEIDEESYERAAAQLNGIFSAQVLTPLQERLQTIHRSAHICLQDADIDTEKAKSIIKETQNIAGQYLHHIKTITTCSELLTNRESKENIKKRSRYAAYNVIKNHEEIKKTCVMLSHAVLTTLVGIWAYSQKEHAPTLCAAYVYPNLAAHFFNAMLPSGEESYGSDDTTLQARNTENMKTCATLWCPCE